MQQEKSYRSCLQAIVDSMFALIDSLVKDGLNMSKDIQDLNASLNLKATKACSTEKVMSKSLADDQTYINNLLAKMDYLSQTLSKSRRS